MRGAGIRQAGGPVEMLDLSGPRGLRPDEVLIKVCTAGVGNWDEIVRTGGWDTGASSPMALGVEAAGTIEAVGESVSRLRRGQDVLTHPLPLRAQGAWAQQLIAAADLVADKPETVSWDEAAAFPVPALTAEQVLTEALGLRDSEILLVHGAGGITGGLVVQLAALRGSHVIATAGPSSQERVRASGAMEVLDYHDHDWPAKAREAAGGNGITAAVNAARGGAAQALRAVAEDGRLATITSDPPAEERGIRVSSFYVRPDGGQLAALVTLLASRRLSLPVGVALPLEQAAGALARAVAGCAGGAVVLQVGDV